MRSTHHAAIRRNFLIGLFAYVVLGLLANLGLAGLQSTTLELLGLTQIGLIGTAWVFKSPRVQLFVVAAMYVLVAWYALNCIPAL